MPTNTLNQGVYSRDVDARHACQKLILFLPRILMYIHPFIDKKALAEVKRANIGSVFSLNLSFT